MRWFESISSHQQQTSRASATNKHHFLWHALSRLVFTEARIGVLTRFEPGDGPEGCAGSTPAVSASTYGLEVKVTALSQRHSRGFDSRYVYQRGSRAEQQCPEESRWYGVTGGSRKTTKPESLAQLAEPPAHNRKVLGSKPRRLTRKIDREVMCQVANLSHGRPYGGSIPPSSAVLINDRGGQR